VDTLSLNEMPVSESNVYVFDFDGVIASRSDDDIYKLPATLDEIGLLSAAAKAFRIPCQGMDQRYQRHLLFQAAAWHLGIPIEAGPALRKAIDCGRRARVFVLTARSGWHAVERLRSFIADANINPVEIFNVGRVKKDRQIEAICREFYSNEVFFIEDSVAHLADARNIAVSNLRLVSIDNNIQPDRETAALRAQFTNTVESALHRLLSERQQNG
jgi:hypothetical protein